MDLKQEPREQRELNSKARFFTFQVEEMHGKRESEFLQQLVVEHRDAGAQQRTGRPVLRYGSVAPGLDLKARPAFPAP
jgi:hypothetical protein